MPTLEVLRGLPHRVFRIAGDRTVVGRDPKCGVWLKFEEVSREHAEILRTNSAWFIRDCGSRNGTYLNDQLLEPGIRHRLQDSDCIQVCDVFLAFLIGRKKELSFAEDHRFKIVDGPPSDAGPTIISSLDMSSSSSERTTVNPAVKLHALLEITRNLRRSLNLDDVLDRVLQTLFVIFPQAERGVVMLSEFGVEESNFFCRAIHHRVPDAAGVIPISKAIIARVIQRREAILSDDAGNDDRFPSSDSIGIAKLRSVVCAPLLDRKGRILGALQLDSVGKPNRFSEEDLDLLANTALLVAFAVENSQLHEDLVDLKVARKIQRSLLPNSTPKHDHYDFYDFYLPAKQVGGDYYDYIDLPDNRLAIVLADVSGKGVGAALLVSKLASETRVFLTSCPNLVHAIDRVNLSFLERGIEGRFVTLVLLVLNLKTHEISIVNAGHQRPLLCTSEGKVRELGDEEAGLPIGMDVDRHYQEFRTQLQCNETIVLYTDGVTDAANREGEFYRSKRLLEKIGSRPATASVMGPEIVRDMRKFIGKAPRTDDICLVCVSRRDP